MPEVKQTTSEKESESAAFIKEQEKRVGEISQSSDNEITITADEIREVQKKEGMEVQEMSELEDNPYANQNTITDDISGA